MFGMTPSCVVSAAPTTAALDRFMSRLRRFEERKSDLLVGVAIVPVACLPRSGQSQVWERVAVSSDLSFECVLRRNFRQSIKLGRRASRQPPSLSERLFGSFRLG